VCEAEYVWSEDGGKAKTKTTATANGGGAGGHHYVSLKLPEGKAMLLRAAGEDDARGWLDQVGGWEG
jgi:hypothetical protein